MPIATPATAFLDAEGVDYSVVEYGRVSSAEEAAEARGIRLEQLVKTLVVRVEEGEYVLVLVPGDGGLDYKKLRAELGVRRLTMPDPAEAKEATGYERGTITPFGAEGGWPVVIDARLEAMDLISLGAGAHGAALNLRPADVISVTGARVLDVGK
ncbi:MAG: hypothetical protein HKN46_03000 [Acidimicrobiia bacterium]|nr:hypothetical protein [Acidimicrobiia bacterium]